MPSSTYKMLNAYKFETEKLCRSKGWNDVPVEKVWLLLSEEFGELASAVRQHQRVFRKTNLKKERGQDVRAEMADVFSYLFQLSAMLKVDLDLMWREHKVKVETKKYVANQ